MGFVNLRGSMRRARMQVAKLGCVALLTFGLGSSARASESERRVGIRGGAAGSNHLEFGPLFGVVAGYGLSDAWDVDFSALVSFHDTRDTSSALIRFVPGVVYKFDVVRWVPYLGAGIGYALVSQSSVQHDVSGDVLAGADYLWSRHWVSGLEYRVTLGTRAPLATPLHELLVSLEYQWGY
jgi:opacity protein-like surface antigen